MSVLAFAPVGQPRSHGPQLLQAWRPSYAAVRIALSDGHQCQPRRSKPRAIVAPSVSSGIGGVCRVDFGGHAGSPVMPATPIMRSFRSKYGSSAA
jgi:hypothetical protein